MKHAISKVYIALFLLLCLLPSLGILVFGESGAAANEILSPRPRWGWEVLSQTADYLADHFALRQPMVALWSRLNAALGHSTDEQVLLGREGWLYYTPSLPDYLGEHLEDEDLEQIARNLARLQQQCEESGRQFLFTIAPNKNSLYPEYMPAWATNGHEQANSVRLRPLLEQGPGERLCRAPLYGGGTAPGRPAGNALSRYGRGGSRHRRYDGLFL